MKTVKVLPGFTAEASLYAGINSYSLEPGAAVSNRVVPQIPIGLCTKAAWYCVRGYENWCDILDRVCFPDIE